jgi:hypothetical protein
LKAETSVWLTSWIHYLKVKVGPNLISFARLFFERTNFSSSSQLFICFCPPKRKSRTMDFERSTQARSWLFDRKTLSLCRQQRTGGASSSDKVVTRVRNFASGFDRRIKSVNSSTSSKASLKRQNIAPTSSKLSEMEEEVLIRFHANQIQALVGPRAIYRELRRNSNVLASAVLLFKRFYLSNSILDFDCRHVAVASALLASKVEPDETIQVRPTSVQCFSRLSFLL